jgi:hypothetical protein
MASSNAEEEKANAAYHSRLLTDFAYLERYAQDNLNIGEVDTVFFGDSNIMRWNLRKYFPVEAYFVNRGIGRV